MVAELLRAKGLHRARIAADSTSGPLARALALMRKSAALSDWVEDRYPENIREGRLLQPLDMSMAAAMVEEEAWLFPGQNLAVMRCWTLSGPASCAPHGDGQPAWARSATSSPMTPPSCTAR
jgi:hypothetical protein